MADTTNKAVWQCSVAIGGVMELLEAKGAEMVDRDLIRMLGGGALAWDDKEGIHHGG
jgi:hypothetical protein